MGRYNSKAFFAIALAVSTLLGGLGQFFFKEGLNDAGLSLALYILLGFAIYAVSTAIYFYVLSRKTLSWTYSFGGLSYIFASILAFLLLGEGITLLRWMGILVIAIGTAVIGLS